MVTALDVDSNKIIEKTAEKLKHMKLEKPAFVGLVKTGPHVQQPPQQDNFWFIRCASVLRHAYVHGKIGTQRLRSHYGGRKSNGVSPEHHKRSGGSTIRKAMQQLEKHGLLEKIKTGGRKITAKGMKLLDGVAKEVS